MIEHGGQLRKIAKDIPIPLENWLDLSTGISPYSWPIPEIPKSVWSRLPEPDDGLEKAAQAYYGVDNLLPISGSQSAIQLLPQLRARSCVAMLPLCYAEHCHAWAKHQHRIRYMDIEQMESSIDSLDVIVLVNPNNPTGGWVDSERLMRWHNTLAAKGGWLIVDEAFIDSNPDQSLVPFSDRRGLIVLRSLGKFFGLAGIRIGFLMAEKALLQQVHDILGPWATNGPGRYIAGRALKDHRWQSIQASALSSASKRLYQTLEEHRLKPSGGCDLFQWVLCNHAEKLYRHLIESGILIRKFQQPQSVRFGLPGDENAWNRLKTSLADYNC